MAKWLLGVDLGGTSTKLAFINLYGEIIHKWEIPTDISENGINITTNIAKTIDVKLAELGETKSRILGIEMGAPCNCDKTGCLETVASATGIVRLAKEALANTEDPSLLQQKLNAGQLLSSKLVFECAIKEDVLSKKIIEKVSFYLGLALSH